MGSSRFRHSSVGEPTRVRTDGSSSQSNADELERLKQRNKRNSGSSYDKYMAQLHEYFDGKRGLPENLRDMLATRPGAEEHGFVAPEGEVEAEPDKGDKKKRKKKRAASANVQTDRRRIVASQGPRKELTDALRRASSPREVEAAVDAMRDASLDLPGDPELLSKALGHSAERVVGDVLDRLSDLADEGPLKGGNLLKSRLDNVALRFGSADITDRCTALQAKLA